MVSVIVPVYDVNRFLNKCISSIVKQTYTDIEIILVDDGSTDGSGKCCDKWQKKDSRIKVIHKENEGVSVARNVGMECARGEYLCFVDSDDFLPEDSIALLMSYMLKSDVDLCCGSWTKIGLKRIDRNKNDTRTIWRSETQGLFEYLNIEEVNGPVAKIYKTDIIRNKGLQFLPGIKIGEDAIFNYQYIAYCRSVAIISPNVYYYNKLNAGSVTHSYYEDFGRCCLLSAIAQVNALNCRKNDFESDIMRQNVFCKRFLSAIYYLKYYGFSEEKAKYEMQRTVQIFNGYLDRDLISSIDGEQYQKVQEILNCCVQNRVPEDFCSITGNKKKIGNFAKKPLLKVMVEYKTAMLVRGKLKI